MKRIISAFIIFFSASLNIYSQQINIRSSEIDKAIKTISVADITSTINHLVSFNTRHNLSTRNDNKYGIGASFRYIKSRLGDINLKGINKPDIQLIDYKAGGKDSRLGREITLTNVIATFKGSNKSDTRIIAIEAHYDSRSFDNNDSTIFAPGANDNGSGTAALLEIAEALSQIELPVTIKLMFVSGEEHGLLGAAYIASIAKQENWNLIAVINNDMIGNSRSSATEIANNTKLRVFSENIPSVETEFMKKERVFNSTENDSKSRELARYIKEIGERYVDNLEIKLIYRNDRYGRGGDHTPFCKEGFSAVRLCEYHENYDRTHQIVSTINGKEFGDTQKGVDYEYVRKNTAVNLAVLINLALAPDVPSNVKMDLSGLSSSTSISWEAPVSGTKAAYYYLLIRETDKSMWEKKIRVSSTNIDVPLSKDNYLFAVQSVDINGYESLPVFVTGSNK